MMGNTPRRTKMGIFVRINIRRFYEMQDVNNGICCDVNVCKHNVNGSQCKLCKIKVTKGDTAKMHYCQSFEDKNC